MGKSLNSKVPNPCVHTCPGKEWGGDFEGKLLLII